MICFVDKPRAAGSKIQSQREDVCEDIGSYYEGSAVCKGLYDRVVSTQDYHGIGCGFNLCAR